MQPLLFALSACSPKDGAVEGTHPSDDSGGGYASAYTDGKYRLSAFTILGEDAGKDWDGDGDPDNKLPDVLAAFDFLLAGFDLSKVGLNTLIADAIRDDTLVVLVEASNANDELTLDFLTGMVDGDGVVSVDGAHSYDAAGDPVSRVVGRFVDASSYVAGPDPIVVSIPVDASSPPAPFPVEEVLMDGGLASIALDGTMVGIVPVDRFVHSVVPIFIPADGFDLNGNGDIDPDTESQSAITALITTLLNTQADLATEDGRPGISAAFHFAASAATFE
jgi:hypothetical protein